MPGTRHYRDRQLTDSATAAGLSFGWSETDENQETRPFTIARDISAWAAIVIGVGILATIGFYLKA